MNMCQVIDITSRLIQEEKLYWNIMIDTASNERLGISRNPANDQIMIFITTYSFDRIQIMRKKALSELKQQLLKNEIEYV